jgi:HD-like signal output (HDOD) protein
MDIMLPDPSASPFGFRLSPDELVRVLRFLPSAPRVLPKLKGLLSDGNSSMTEVVSLIRLDPGIAARVLQIGNSAYYSQGLRCYTVEEAVNRVGYDEVYGLVANAVASQVLIRPLVAYGLEADDLWRKSVACAIGAELLSERLEIGRDIAYTVGLLHGVGMVAIDEWAFRQQTGMFFAAGELPLETCEAERATLGFHNAEAGAALLRLWEFPAVMTEPVRWQYLPRGTAAHFPLSGVLHVAKWLRDSVCSEGERPNQPDPLLLRALKVTRAQLDKLADEVRLRMEDVSSLLDSSLPDKSCLTFPNGEREIASHAVTRSFIDRYV